MERQPGMLVNKKYRILRQLKSEKINLYVVQNIRTNETRVLRFLDRDGFFLNYRLRERQIMRRVYGRDNKHIVECGELEVSEDGCIFYSMEFVNGPTLRELLNQATSPIAVPMALRIVRGIAEGLRSAHAFDLVHFEIRPEKILLTWNGSSWTPKISDFGYKARHEMLATYREKFFDGCSNYDCPESRNYPFNKPDGRWDFYSLGVILLEMLVGPVVACVSEVDERELYLLRSCQRPSTLRPELENWKGLDGLMRRLLAMHGDYRPRDVADLIRDLDHIEYA
jgi:serine/threonine protein kinase